MRIGRNLTVTEIDNRITNYNQNYELTETQIDSLLSNVDGAIGCLAQRVGLMGRTVPITCLHATDFKVATGGTVYVSFDGAYVDNLECWDSEKPTELNLTYNGIYAVSIQATWPINATGYRRCSLAGGGYPDLSSKVQGEASVGVKNLVGGEAQLYSSDVYKVLLYQTSGSELTLTSVKIFIIRRTLGIFIPVE